MNMAYCQCQPGLNNVSIHARPAVDGLTFCTVHRSASAHYKQRRRRHVVVVDRVGNIERKKRLSQARSIYTYITS